MDPMDFLDADELLRFFHCNKTEMSCMENPHIFLNQLRDHNLIPEDSYKKVSRMKSKDNMKKGLYDILDWLEKERSEHIDVFWRCVFKETIMNQYPTLRELRKSLMDGSFHFYTKLPEKVEQEETDERKRKGTSEDEEGEEKQTSSVKKKRKQKWRSGCDLEETDKRKRKGTSEDEEGEEKQTSSVKKKRKQRRRSGCDLEEEQPGPSSQLTLSHNKKPNKIVFSPLKKGEKSEIWTWAIYKTQLPVTCGVQKGTLNKDRLAKGEKSILVNKQWYTPTEFERLAGKESYKNWKMSIRCSDTPLIKLIQDGHLKSVRYKGGCKKSKKCLFPSNTAITVTDGEEDEEDEDEEDQESLSERESSPDVTDEGETEEEPQTSSGQKVFKVTCGDKVGTLHKKRFASGTCGKSIRTETSWMNPEEFMREVLTERDASWRKEVLWEGKPLSVLIEAKILRIHSLLCTCKLCSQKPDDLDNQRNDDDCSICKTEDEEKLVECDECPRSFHQECHLPHVEDTILEDDAPWVCTFCVFRRNQQWRYSELEYNLERNAVMTRQISSHMLECQYLLLSLYSADEEQNFATNPSLYLGNYTTVIKTPMWLGNVADKLQRDNYQTVGEFVSDVELIFTNCALYNKDNAEFLAIGVRLKELFDGEFKNAFSIHEDAEL